MLARPAFVLVTSLAALTAAPTLGLERSTFGQAPNGAPATTPPAPLTPAPVTRPATPPTAPAAPAASQLPPDIQALKTELDTLDGYLRRKGSVTKDDHAAIGKLLDKVRPFATAKQPMAMAMQVQLATWLDDRPLVDETYANILSLNPSNEVALSQWFGAMNKRNDFERTVQQALERNAVVGASARASVPVIEALIALNRIGDAKARVDGITLAATERPDVSSRINALKTRIDALHPLWQAEDALRQADESAGNLPRVEIVTSRGPIVVELFEDQAPNSVAAFLSFVEAGQYAGTKFHKRVPNIGLLGGDPNSKAGAAGRPGFGTPGYRLPDEAGLPNHRLALAGTIGFAKADAPPATPAPDAPPPPRTVKDSAGATFFLLTQPAEHLVGECTVFGRIVSGSELLATLSVNDTIESTKVLRKREHEYTVTKAPELPTPPELTIPTVMPARPPVNMNGPASNIQPVQLPVTGR